MKRDKWGKYFGIFVVLLVVAVAAKAACSLTGGACSSSDLHIPSLNESVMPNSLQSMQKPNYFQNLYQQQNYETNSNNIQHFGKEGGVMNGGYNANCQFGLCIMHPVEDNMLR